MIFGLFFGAGNLIFPVHMGQEAGQNIFPVVIGFILTGVGLPFLGIMAIGVSKVSSLYELAKRVHPAYAVIFTVLLNLAIGPLFALPRLGSVSYQIGIAPFISGNNYHIILLLFTFCFYCITLALSLKPGKILLWIGKILNPLFLLFLGILMSTALYHANFSAPLPLPVAGTYTTSPFFRGFIEGYNTIDAVASLVFGIIIITTLQSFGLKSPRDITLGLLKSGFIAIFFMSLIYACLAYIGVYSLQYLTISANGGIALAQIAAHFLGTGGSIILAIVVTIACLKTGIGITSAIANSFVHMFPNSLSYRQYTILFSIIAFVMSNISLTQIIILGVPLLMFLYPLCITIILLAFLSPLFQHDSRVYLTTTFCTILAAFGDAVHNLPANITSIPSIENIIAFYHSVLPFFAIGMGWVVPASLGFIAGIIWHCCAPTKSQQISAN